MTYITDNILWVNDLLVYNIAMDLEKQVIENAKHIAVNTANQANTQMILNEVKTVVNNIDNKLNDLTKYFATKDELKETATEIRNEVKIAVETIESKQAPINDWIWDLIKVGTGAVILAILAVVLN